jgi:hypothetical protein
MRLSGMSEKSKPFKIIPGENEIDTPCLSLSQLIGYNKNNLQSQELEKIEHHVKFCDLCADAVSGKTTVSDTEKVKQNILDINKKIHQRLVQKTHRRIDAKVYYAAAAVLLITFVYGFQLFFQQPAHEKLFAEYFKPYPNTIPLVRGSVSAGDLEIAMTQYELGNFSNSLSQLKIIITKDADNATAHFYTGICLLETKRVTEAILHFENVNKESNFGKPAEWYAALAHLKNKNVKTAKQILNHIVKTGETYSHKSKKLLKKINALQ